MSKSESISDKHSWQSKESSKNKRARTSESPLRLINIPILNIRPYESTRQYRKKICMYTFNAFCLLLIGAVNMSVIIYSAYFKDVHAALCCLGQHLFIALGILSRNRYNCWTIAYLPQHSKLVHVILQLVGVLLSLSGMGLITIGRVFFITAHGITGMVSLILCIITMMLGTCVIYSQDTWKELHRWMGLFAFFMSTICLVLGLMTPVYRNWMGNFIVTIMIIFILMYSLFIIVSSFNSAVKKMKRRKRLIDLS